MKFMQTINELQAVVKKLITEMQKDYAGTAGESERCKKCGRTSEIVKLAQACPFCDPPWLDDCKKWMDKVRSNRERRDLGGDPTPDLPLHVRVAKALGYKVIKRQTGKWSMPRTSMEQEYIEYVPDYPNDLVAAMGALEEYREQNNMSYWIKCIGFQPKEYKVEIAKAGKGWEGSESEWRSALPQAICEAIVAHAEGK